MIARVNGLVLLPHLADWSSPPKTERRWQSTLATAVTGAEDRAALRQTPLQVIKWQIVPFDLVERGLLEDRIRVALLEGQAITPWWGRGLLLASAASGTTVTLDGSTPAAKMPAAGSRIWFGGDWATDGGAAWEVAEVLSVAGSVITLTGALANTWPAGSSCWELICGKLTADNSTAMTPHTGRYGFTLTGYRGAIVQYPTTAASIGTSNLSAVDPYRRPAPWPAEIARVSLLTANLHTPVAQIFGTTSYGLALTSDYSPVWEESQDGGATWNDVTSSMIEETTPGYWRYLLPFQNNVLIRVQTLFFSTAVASEPITIEATTVERMMRVTQERWAIAGGGSAFTWPVRTTDSHSPGSYPPDGFYAADFAADAGASVHTREIALLESIRLAVRTTNFSSRYLDTTQSIVAGVITPEANAYSPIWTFTPGSGFTAAKYGPRLVATSLFPSAVSTGNRLTIWRDLNRYLLRLHKAFLPAEIGEHYPDDNCLISIGVASQSTGDMKPNVFGGGTPLATTARTSFDLAPYTTDLHTPRGIWSRVIPTSVTPSGITQILNAPGTVEIWQAQGSFIVDMSTIRGLANLYRSTYYHGYALSFYPGVVDQHGLTPYYDISPDGLTDIFYNVGSTPPTNIPDAGTMTAHTKFVLVNADPIPPVSLYVTPLYCDALKTSIPFRWYNINIPILQLGFDVYAYVVLYKSPAVEDADMDHYVHVLPP